MPPGGEHVQRHSRCDRVGALGRGSGRPGDRTRGGRGGRSPGGLVAGGRHPGPGTCGGRRGHLGDVRGRRLPGGRNGSTESLRLRRFSRGDVQVPDGLHGPIPRRSQDPSLLRGLRGSLRLALRPRCPLQADLPPRYQRGTADGRRPSLVRGGERSPLPGDRPPGTSGPRPSSRTPGRTTVDGETLRRRRR